MVWQETPPRFAIARYCFKGTRKDEGTLKVGDWVTLQEKHSDGKWYRGFYSFMREDPDSSKLFLFPACCLKIAPASFRPTSSTHGPNAEFNSHKLLIDSLPLIKEDRLLETVTKSILEWSTVISEAEKEFAEDTTEREPNPEAEQLKHPLSDLMLLRKTILSTRPDDMRRVSLENQSISLIDYGNRLMGLDLILRDRQSSSRLHHRNTGSIRLFQRHQEIELQDRKKEKGDGSRPKEKSSNPRKTLLQARSRRRLAANMHDGKGLTDAIQRLQTLRKNCVCIVFDFKTFIYSLGENEASLYFSLWSAKTRDFLTEEFPVHVSSFGMPHNFSDPNFKSPHCLFVDIPEDEFHDREVFFAVRVVRFGKLLLDPTKQVKGQDNLRRPLGWGLIPVNSFKIRKTAKERSIPIFGAVQEATFSQGPSAISKNSGTFIQIPDCMVVVSCKAIDLPYHLLHKRQREMERSGKTIPTLENFQEMPLMVRLANLDIPDLLIPGQILSRNILYITLNEAILSQEKRFNSLELVLWVKNNQGKNIECCFELEPGKPKTSSHSIVFHHNHNPKWGETIKIVIPPEEMLNSHIYFDMRLWSSKERVYDKRVMAFWKLTRDGILQQNGKYDLSLVKLPKIIKDPAFYLTEEDVADKHKLNISVKISSTHFSQNEVICNLLNWKENVQLQEALNKFPFVPLPEILMHLPAILHALLSMMESDNKMSIFAYNTLLWVISTLVDDKTERCMIFMQKLHTYVPKNTTIHEVLTKSMLYYLGMYDSKSHNKYVRATLKALNYLFKMVIASTQSSTSSLKSNSEQLKKDILEIFERLTDLIKLNDALLIATQVGCMQAFGETLPLLGGLLDDTSITKFICKYLSALPGFEAYRQAVSEKLSLFEAVVNCEYYLSQESNVVLMAVTLANILEPYIVSTKLQEVSEGINILNIFLDGVQSKSKFFNSIVTTFLPLIGKLSGAALKFSYDKTVFRSLSTILLSILDGSFPQKILTHLEKMSPVERQNTLDTLLTQLWKIISSDTYPPQWFTMWLFAFDVSIRTMTVLRPIILSSIETIEKEKELWHVVLKLCLALLNHKAIKFDRDISRKSLADEVLQERSDLEREVAGILNEMWEKINRQEAQFASVVVEPFVELLLLNHQPDIQDTAHRIFKSLLYHEFVTTQSIVKISGQTVDCFCSVSKKDGIPHDHFTGSIIPMLQQIFEGPSVDKRIKDTTAFQKAGVSLLRDLTELVQLLSQLEQIPDGIEWEDEKTIATFGLMEFFKRTNKQGPYISYIHQLVNQHESANRMAEAALSLMLHAELLNYSDEMLPELQQFPAQTSFERKRNLMMRAIDFFEKGKDWERAIDLLNQMSDLYKVRYDYQRVAEGLRMQAKLYENIITKERYLAEHFRVIFYGSGFPPTLRNREFIYRGFECERITAFISRMMSRFPRALQLPSNEAVPDSVINGDGQWLVIATVYPSSEDEMNRRRIEIDRKIPKFIRNYQRGRDLKVFTYSRPFRKSQTKSDNEFKDMWTMQYFLQVAQAFPSTQSRSEVIIRKEVELSPIETAIDAIRTKNSQVLDLVAFHKDPDNQGANINTLTLALNGVIDAEVNGGTKKYQEAFFSDAFKQQNPDRLQNIIELKEALLESIPILAEGLTVHRNKCPENLQALQDKLETFYERMKTTIAATCT